jgi:hypothetical protein
MNTDAVSMLKIKKPNISQFKIIFTYSYYHVFVYYNKITHSIRPPIRPYPGNIAKLIRLQSSIL